MTEKIGRNDPCPCGSGKKFKQCCFLTKGGSGVKRKLSAVWVNKPAIQEGVNLMERTFGGAISELSAKTPTFLTPPSAAVLPDVSSIEQNDSSESTTKEESSQE